MKAAVDSQLYLLIFFCLYLLYFNWKDILLNKTNYFNRLSLSYKVEKRAQRDLRPETDLGEKDEEVIVLDNL